MLGGAKIFYGRDKMLGGGSYAKIFDGLENITRPANYMKLPCSTPELELMDRNIDNMNQNCSPINIYIDLCKAFDCLDHAILLSKLKYYGLNDNAVKLLKKLSI